MFRNLFLLALVVLAGCDVYVVEHEPHHVKSYEHQVCYVYEPYSHMAEEYYEYYDYYGYYEGQCAVWYVGYGVHEEWCLWDEYECSDWEFVAEFYYY